jgi:antitoxin VapB
MNARLPYSVTQTPHRKDSTVFTSGNSQAVRIPKEFQFDTKQVTIVKKGNELIIKPKFKTLGELLDSLPPWTEEDKKEWDKVIKTIQEGRKNMLPLRDLSHLFADDAPPEDSPKAKPATRSIRPKKATPKKKIAS